MLRSVAIVLLSVASVCVGLECYHNQLSGDPNLVVRSNRTEWKLCVTSISRSGGPPSYFGVTEAIESRASLKLYNSILSDENPPIYMVKSICIVEEFNIKVREQILRCLCNKDGCNKPGKVPKVSKGLKIFH